MITTVGSRAIHEFRTLIQQEIEELKNTIAAGSLESFEQYKYMCGKIAALRSSLDAVSEAEKIAESKA
jgi:hypothetical protein